MSVTASANSHVLHVTVRADTPDAAARAANAAAAALTSVRRTSLGALRIDQLRQLRLFITAQDQLLAKEQTQGIVIPAYDDLSAAILELKSDLQQLEEARSTPAEIVSPAIPPVHADHANTEVPLTSGVMIGLLCGCLLGAARDRADRNDRSSPRPRSTPSPFGDLPETATRHEDYDHVY